MTRSTTSAANLLPNGFGFVALAAVGAIWLVAYQTSLVGAARRKAGIKVPQLYATLEQQEKSVEAMKFNCTQRAHQNTLETLGVYFVTLFITGILHPRVAVGGASLWLVGRFFFTRGYASGVPSARSTGAKISWVGLLTLLVASTWTAIELINKMGAQI